MIRSWVGHGWQAPTKVDWNGRTESCFEDAKAYSGNHEPGLIKGGGLPCDSRVRNQFCIHQSDRKMPNHEGGADTPPDSCTAQPNSRGEEFGEDDSWIYT